MSGCGRCRECPGNKESVTRGAEYTIALAGNANVGKSTLFNQLTGVGQVIGNWPGKTVERRERSPPPQGLRIRVIDLPGIYSFSTYSLEEEVSRDFIALECPDAVIDVVDATALERNLFFTIQLMELAPPMLVAVNQVDLAEKKGMSIDTAKLAALLGVPVLPTVAARGKGIAALADAIANLIDNQKTPTPPRYGKEVEERIEKVTALIGCLKLQYPARWTAIKLLEGDPACTQIVSRQDPSVIEVVKELGAEIEAIHGEPVSVVMSEERYHVADRIADQVVTIRALPGESRGRV